MTTSHHPAPSDTTAGAAAAATPLTTAEKVEAITTINQARHDRMSVSSILDQLYDEAQGGQYATIDEKTHDAIATLVLDGYVDGDDAYCHFIRTYAADGSPIQDLCGHLFTFNAYCDALEAGHVPEEFRPDGDEPVGGEYVRVDVAKARAWDCTTEDERYVEALRAVLV